ncbi:MAG: FtsK/SpoIIIE family DNA translocase [Anaerolineaceae bacterium]
MSKNQLKSKDQSNQPVSKQVTRPDWSVGFFQSLYRYGWDLLAVFTLIFGLLTLFGIIGWTQGSFISFWVEFLNRWLGWGYYGVPIFLMALSYWIFRRRVAGGGKIHLGIIVSLEISFFLLLALFSIFGNVDLSRAESGNDGGIIGWGLANLFLRFLPDSIIKYLLIFLIILFLASGLGFFKFLIVSIDLFTKKLSSSSEDPYPFDTEQQTTFPHNNGVEKLSQDQINSPVLSKPAVNIFRNQKLPAFELLAKEQTVIMDDFQVRQMGIQIEKTLEEFGIPAKVAGYRVGPTVTQFAVEPGFVEREGSDGTISKHKVRVSQVSSLAKDLALALSAERLRVEAPIPGQSYIGIEVPNPQSKIVRLRPILESNVFQKVNSLLALALGQDVSGQPVVADLIKMPHLLIAGTTGSGKSVCVSAITMCLLMNNSPESLRLAMLDPKMVELARFNGVPHLLGKVETSIDRMVGVLHWALAEMDRRYRLLEDAKARDLDAYNIKMSRKNQPTLPRIVILIDELADLMMTSAEQTEQSLVRLAQMARAIGIHLIVATQRPSTDVVTGLIKANFPARISFAVASSIDSRVILDVNGAETLMGKGDMLYLAPDVGAPQRAQGVFVTDQEIDNIIHYWQNEQGSESNNEAPWEDLMKVMEDDTDDLVKQAINLVKTSRRASASLLQRKLRIGFPRAARLLDQLEEMGVVGPSQGGGRDREVLIDSDDDWEKVDRAGEDEH